MATLRKLLLSGLVWQTAIAVGLAGLPTFHCHCVPGHTRPLALVSLTTGCCCTPHEPEGCCPTPEGPSDEEEPPSCCQRAAVPVAEADEATLQGTAAICTGSLSQADAFLSSPELTVSNVDTAPLCPLLLPVYLVVPSRPLSVPFLEPDDRSPPTDRIIVFEHFLI